MGGQEDGWADRKMDERTGRWMGGQEDGWANRRWMGGQEDGWADRKMDGDRWVDRHTQKDGQVDRQSALIKRQTLFLIGISESMDMYSNTNLISAWNSGKYGHV